MCSHVQEAKQILSEPHFLLQTCALFTGPFTKTPSQLLKTLKHHHETQSFAKAKIRCNVLQMIVGGEPWQHGHSLQTPLLNFDTINIWPVHWTEHNTGKALFQKVGRPRSNLTSCKNVIETKFPKADKVSAKHGEQAFTFIRIYCLMITRCSFLWETLISKRNCHIWT